MDCSSYTLQPGKKEIACKNMDSAQFFGWSGLAQIVVVAQTEVFRQFR